MKKFIVWFVGTAGGAGFFPKAPGTAGTVVAIPIAFFTADWSCGARVALWTFLFVIGTWAAKNIDQLSGKSDNQKIVVDEVVGYGITAWTAGHNTWAIVAAFLLFRLFDTTKPPPIRQVDNFSKKKSSERSGEASAWWGGFGVMADDVLAGVLGLVVMLILQNFHVI